MIRKFREPSPLSCALLEEAVLQMMIKIMRGIDQLCVKGVMS